MICLSAAERSFDVKGVIRSALADGQVTIDHEEMPGYMGAMTMPFNVKDETSASTLMPGDVVMFRFRVSGRSSWAENFKVIGREEGVEEQTSLKTKEGEEVPSFQLITQSKAKLTEADLKGRFTVATFIFTRCPVPEFCPAMAHKFGALQRAIKADEHLAGNIRLLSISLDPEYDTPEVLADYAERVGADSSVWEFATGDAKEIAKLAGLVGLRYSGTGTSIEHSLKTVLIGPDGKLAKVWTGNRWDSDDVIEAIESCGNGASSCCCAK